MKRNDIEKRIANSVVLSNEKVLIRLISGKCVNININSLYNRRIKELQGMVFKTFEDYTVLKSLIKIETDKVFNLWNYIENAFLNDVTALKQEEIVAKDLAASFNMNLNDGDFHNGRRTSTITVNSESHLIFKPTDGKITIAFNNLLDWVNIYHNLGNYKFRIVNRTHYHWLEFVKQGPITKQEQICKYYMKAGYMIFITYLLNSSDYHFENVICNGDSPILIDHETIVQPRISKQIRSLIKTFDNGSISDTILDSKLLPNTLYKENSVLRTGICGFGWQKQQSIMSIETVAANRFTEDWKMITKFVQHDLFKYNIPEYEGERVYLTDYLVDFIEGFEICYNFFLSQKNFLLDDEGSPFSLFKDCKIRYIWRPTNVYSKIFDAIKFPENLVSHKHYEQKIHDYLAVAFKNVPKDSDLMLIHKHEVAQMLRGDIPFFEVNSSSRDLETEFGTVKDFFEYSAVENIQRKLKKLSLEDLEYQKSLIKKSLLS